MNLRLELASDLPEVVGDRLQLQQVVLNLITNAVQAMSDVDTRPRELLVRTETEDGAQLLVTVQNSGGALSQQ
jgi:C4-dicarboxylate-specific signal transduction histidine kinase